MKRLALTFLRLIAPGIVLFTVTPAFGQAETLDLKALAKKARPAVMLLVVSDATGKEIGTGTGFLVSSDGKLVTNYHVIEKAASAIAKAENGGLFHVEGVLASDQKNDLVLLKIKGKDLPFLTLGNGDKIEVGTRISVIGSPLGLEGTLSEGIVSALREVVGDRKLVQVTAAISPGSSGSPLLNSAGEVIGVARALLREGQALNFAVPVDRVTFLLAVAKKVGTPQSLDKVRKTEGFDAELEAVELAGAAEDWVDMLKQAKGLVSRYPNEHLAHYALGYAYDRLKFSDEAIAAFQQVTRIRPDLAFGWYAVGYHCDKTGRKEEAISAYRQALKCDPNYAAAWHALGLIQVQEGRTEDAIAAFKEAIKLKPEDVDAWNALADCYGASSKYVDEALHAYLLLTKLTPDSDTTWAKLGACYALKGKHDEAFQAFQTAAKVKPDSQTPWAALAGYLEFRNQREQALQVLLQGTKDYPKSGGVRFVLGSYLLRLGQQKEAIASFQEAAERSPDPVNSWIGIGTCYSVSNQFEQAIQYFGRASKLKPDSIEAWSGLALSYYQAEKWDEADSALRFLATLQADEASTWCYLGWCNIFRGKIDEAHSIARKAIATHSTKLTEVANLAELLLALGKLEDYRLVVGRFPAELEQLHGGAMMLYFRALELFQLENSDGLRGLVSGFVAKASPGKKKYLGNWSLNEVRQLISRKTDSPRKRCLLTFIRLLNGEITPAEALKQME